MHTFDFFTHPWFHYNGDTQLYWYSVKRSGIAFHNFCLLRIVMSSFELPLKVCLGVSPFEQNPLFVCLSVGQHHFIISFFYKRDNSVPCFMVAVIYKATTWLFQEKKMLFCPWSWDADPHLRLETLLVLCWWVSPESYIKRKGLGSDIELMCSCFTAPKHP